jgi:hypothetical protein
MSAGCKDCGANLIVIGEFCTLQPRIYGLLGLDWADNLCVGCLEARLGRKLCPADMGTFPAYSSSSKRLRERLGMRPSRAAQQGIKDGTAWAESGRSFWDLQALVINLVNACEGLDDVLDAREWKRIKAKGDDYRDGWIEGVVTTFDRIKDTFPSER